MTDGDIVRTISSVTFLLTLLAGGFGLWGTTLFFLVVFLLFAITGLLME